MGGDVGKQPPHMEREMWSLKQELQQVCTAKARAGARVTSKGPSQRAHFCSMYPTQIEPRRVESLLQYISYNKSRTADTVSSSTSKQIETQ